MKINLAAVLACQLLAVLATPSRKHHQRVMYIQDNNPSGNSILAAEISNRDGTLSPGVRTNTGGKGLELFIALSTGLVKVYDNYLFTPNAGDNTLSMFLIDPRDPLRPRLVGRPASTLGQNPCSVTYSPQLQKVCVGNGGVNEGDVSTVTCFSVDPVAGLRVSDHFESSPNPGGPGFVPFLPGILIKDIVFNPSSSALFVASFHSPSTPSYIYVYPVIDGRISQTPVISGFPDSISAFSMNFLGSDDRMFVTNVYLPGAGAAIMDVDSSSFNITSTAIDVFPHFENSVPCWATYAPHYDAVFVADFRYPNLTAVSATDGTTISNFTFPTPSWGGLDNIVNGDYFYQLNAPFTDNFNTTIAPFQVLVYDIKPIKRGGAPRLVQSFDMFKAFGKGYELQGMALWRFIPSDH